MAFPNDISIEVKKNPNEELWDNLNNISQKLPALARSELLLLCFDMRPVAEIVVWKNKDISEVDFTKFGLSCSKRFDENEKRFSLFLSKDKELASEAESLNHGTVGGNSTERFGVLMGYPNTAVESFVNGTSITDGDTLSQLLGYNEEIFGFGFSNPPTDEEITYLVRANKLLLKYAPDIVDQFMHKESAEEYIKDVKAFLEKYSNLE